jgi:hypothetical protein
MSKATDAQEFITEFANAFSGSGDSVKLDEFFADDVVYSDYSKWQSETHYPASSRKYQGGKIKRGRS